MSQKLAQQGVGQHRSRPPVPLGRDGPYWDGRPEVADAAPAIMTPQQASIFQEQLQRGIERGVRAIVAQQTPQVLVVAREIPEGIASGWLPKMGYYPTKDGVQELCKVYLKHQPTLKDLPDFTNRVGLAVRNARSHLSRLTKSAMPGLYPHETDAVTGAAEVRDVRNVVPAPGKKGTLL